jgi:hypothetical protein
MKKVMSILSMLIFVAGFAMAQAPTPKKSTKAETNKEAKADTTKKSHGTMKHHTGKKGTTTKTTKKSSTSTTTEKSTK